MVNGALQVLCMHVCMYVCMYELESTDHSDGWLVRWMYKTTEDQRGQLQCRSLVLSYQHWTCGHLEATESPDPLPLLRCRWPEHNHHLDTITSSVVTKLRRWNIYLTSMYVSRKFILRIVCNTSNALYWLLYSENKWVFSKRLKLPVLREQDRTVHRSVTAGLATTKD